MPLQHPLLTKFNITQAGKGKIFKGSVTFSHSFQGRVSLELTGNKKILEQTGNLFYYFFLDLKK